MPSFIRDHIRHWKAYTPGEQPPQKRQIHKISPQDTEPDLLAVIKLNTNESPFPNTKVQDHIASLHNPNHPPVPLHLYPDPAATLLRETASKTLAISPDHLVFGNGSDELIAAIFRAFCDPCDRVIIPTPTYGAYRTTAELYTIAIDSPHLNSSFSHEEPSAFTLSPTTLAQSTGKVVFFPNPHAPSGKVTPKETLLNICKDYPDKLFIIDEAYVDFAKETLIHEATSLPNLIVLRTLSKAMALAGLRVGYAVSTQEHVQALRKVLDPYNLNALSQELATVCLQNLESSKQAIESIIQNRASFVQSLAKLGFITHPSSANFILTAPLHYIPRDAPQTSGEKKSQKLSLTERSTLIYKDLKKNNILVRYFATPELAQYLRITIGRADEMKKVLTTLETLQA